MNCEIEQKKKNNSKLKKLKKLCLLVRVDQLLRDVVKEVPASVGKRALQERQCDQAYVVILEGLESICRLQPVVVT